MSKSELPFENEMPKKIKEIMINNPIDKEYALANLGNDSKLFYIMLE